LFPNCSELEFPNLFHTNESDVKSSLSHNHKSNECFSIPLTHYSNYNDTTTDNFIMLMQQPSICLQQLLPVNNICTYCKSIHSTSSNHLHSLNMSWHNPMNYGSLPTDQITSVNQIAMHHSKHNINNTNIPLNPVDVMQVS
uniref:Ovule protein n=1 Tax=Schistosoma curassoni TaxID=6186 RepID=A0A183L6S4_9TREM